MDDKDYKEESLFRRIEGWTLEWDLHIWYAAVSLIAICVLVFIFNKEVSVNQHLRDQATVMQAEYNKQQLQILDLKAENEKQRSLYLLPAVMPANAGHENVDKTANKVNEKIGKVQEILIDKALNQPTKVKTETINTTIEVKTVVNKELNTIMKDSYCATVPSAKECIK